GIEFAKSKEYCKKAFEAGMRYAYLQFDGIGNDANSHRQVGNLFDVKLRAIENMHEAGIEIVLVVTIVNNVNNDQVGTIVKFAMENPKKIAFVSFQPVSFTGRDEDITPERRHRQRYTLSHLAKDVSKQVGKVEPTRDWFPISFVSTFAGFSDLVHGPDEKWGALSCGCHPNCGVGTALMINKEPKEWAPGPHFLFIAGMWFQDLFNYDFRRTEMCIIPYATQQGEISFCAYNTGIGWRKIIENMHKNATVAEWYRTHGKHEIYAKGKSVNLESYEHSLKIDAEDAARVRHLEHDVPLTAAEEDRARRKKAYEEQAKVRAIYEELVLKKTQPAVVHIGTVQDIAKAVPANFANAGKPVTIAPASGNGHSN